jgi:hypothetical protein
VQQCACPTGKDSEIALSQTSFSASCARACTDDDGIFEHHTQLQVSHFPNQHSQDSLHSNCGQHCGNTDRA